MINFFPAFNTPINRKNTNCSKWDDIPYPGCADDVIPMWVADMDFACPPVIIDCLRQRLKHPVFGYMKLPDTYFSSIIRWHQNRYHSCLSPSDIFPVSSVLGGVSMAVQALTKKGEAVLVPTPGYHAFYNCVTYNERTLVSSPMINQKGEYRLDFERIEQQIKLHQVKLLLFCSPHNPTGRIWSPKELSELVNLCCRHHVYLISDEIHSDMTLTHPFSPIFSAGSQAEEIAIALYAPTKTFNLAGLCTAYAVIKNPELASSFQKAVLASGLKVKNTMGIEALISGYQEGESWLEELQKYLLANAQYATDYIEHYIPRIHARLPQATYFLWMDCSEKGLSANEILQKFVREAHVAITSGSDFIQGGESFVRLNYACPRSLLEEALNRIRQAFA